MDALNKLKIAVKIALLGSITVVVSNGALAARYDCKVRSNGYSGALNAASGNMHQQLKIVKSWMPEVLSVTPQKIIFNGSNAFDVISGDREKTFVISRTARTSTSNVYNLTYRLSVDPYGGYGTLYMEQTGYKRLGPVRYNCNKTDNTNVATNLKSDDLRNRFNKLDMCNRRYLQQFLKGLGLYGGGVDAKWGQGTRTGVIEAMKLPKFRGKSSEYFFSKIKDNPMC